LFGGKIVPEQAIFKKNFLPFAEHDILKGSAVPEYDRNLGGVRAAGMDFIGNIGGEATLNPRGKPTPHKIEHHSETFAEKQIYKMMKFLTDEVSYVEKGANRIIGTLEDSLFWIGHQMAKHPIITFSIAAPIAIGVYDARYNDGKIAKNTFDSAKSAGKSIAGGASFFAGIGASLAPNQPPVADFEINGNLTEGSPIGFHDKSYDPDGKIARSELTVDGKATPTPQNLSQGRHEISLTVYDDGGKSAVKSRVADVGEKPHQFTPDLKVFGSDEYKKRVQDSLDELNKTPDSFRINGMTAYEYATYYMDDLHEGNEEKYIDVGKEQYPIKYISASNMIHIPRHIEQGQNQTYLANMKEWQKKGEWGGLFGEHDAIKLQVSWEKAQYNLTDEETKNRFISYMKQYTNDSKYFEEELIKS